VEIHDRFYDTKMKNYFKKFLVVIIGLIFFTGCVDKKDQEVQEQEENAIVNKIQEVQGDIEKAEQYQENLKEQADEILGEELGSNENEEGNIENINNSEKIKVVAEKFVEVTLKGNQVEEAKKYLAQNLLQELEVDKNVIYKRYKADDLPDEFIVEVEANGSEEMISQAKVRGIYPSGNEIAWQYSFILENGAWKITDIYFLKE
jgi:uncharacterized lipoprotein YajG